MGCLQRWEIPGLLALVVNATVLSPVWAAVHLQCQVTYAGTTETIIATPTNTPYTAPAVDIAGRFRFKPVLVGQGTQLQYVSIYVYLQTQHQPVLIQQAKYFPPYPPTGAQGHTTITGEQRLYAGPMERELIYQCTFVEEAP